MSDGLYQAEFEFYQFRAPSNPEGTERNSSGTAKFLKTNPVADLSHLTEGMFGYSLTRPVHNQEYYYGIFDTCQSFKCDIESWHTESGPGVFEAVSSIIPSRRRTRLTRPKGFGVWRNQGDSGQSGPIQVSWEAIHLNQYFSLTTAPRYVVKSLGSKHGITPVFMAKPVHGLPGNSGHMHVSIVDGQGQNLFCREKPDTSPPYEDVANLSDLGRNFLAGVLAGLPDIMPILAPTINSYKRLVENFWAPVTVSWGLEHRAASVRLIAPPTCSPKACRLEVRVPGADVNAHYVLAAIIACGWRGVEKKLEIPVPPLARGEDVGSESDKGERLAKSLKEAVTRFMAKESVAREVFGNEFVDHFGGTREHEIKLWEEAVTDW